MTKLTICDYVAKCAERSSEKPALKFKKDDQWIDVTWAEYYQSIERVGCGLLSFGIKPQDRIAIMSNTRYEWSTCDYAILSIQAVTVPIYQTVTADDLEYTLNNSQAKILFIENKNVLKTYNLIKDKCPSVEKVIVFESTSDLPEGCLLWDDFLAYASQEQDDQRAQFRKLIQSTRLDEMATLIYTSGTTGRPKGVVLTHTQIMSEVSEAFPYLGATEKDTSLSFLPYAHILGRIETWGHMYSGFTMAFAEGLDRIRQNLTEIKPTFMIAVPRIFEKVYSAIMAQKDANPFKSTLFNWALKVGTEAGAYRLRRESLPLNKIPEWMLAKKLVLDKVKAAFGGKLRFCVSGGAPLAKDIALFFHACDVLILEGYGLTETTAAICVNTPFDYRFGSVGKPIGDVQLKIADDGEVLVKSHKVMKSYYKDDEATQAVLKEGWFHTGDIGEILPSGDLRITDRKKDLIKTAGGKYIAPQKLEGLLKTNPLIAHVLVHGDQKKYVVALITLEKAHLVSFAKEKGISYQDVSQLTQHPQVLESIRKSVAEANRSLASFESIKRFSVLPVEFSVDSGELTPSLKVKRKVLDQKFKKEIEALYL
jgi:long-chain acyl-CoA synthetase